MRLGILWFAALVAPPGPATVLDWRAPPSCPTQAAIEAEVERLLGRELRAKDSAKVHADAAVTISGDRWYAEISLETPSGSSRRRLDARACATIADALAIEVALAIDPLAVSGAPVGVEEPAPEPARPPAPPTRAEALDHAAPLPSDGSRREVRRARRRPIGVLALGGGVSVAELSEPSAALELMGGVQWRHVRLETGVRSVGPRVVQSSEVPSFGARLYVAAWATAACGVARIRPVELPACAGLELGVIRGVGRGLPEPSATNRLWLSATLATGVTWEIVPRFAIGARVAPALHILRPGFAIDGLGSLYRVPLVGLRAQAVLELRFPGANAKDSG